MARVASPTVFLSIQIGTGDSVSAGVLYFAPIALRYQELRSKGDLMPFFLHEVSYIPVAPVRLLSNPDGRGCRRAESQPRREMKKLPGVLGSFLSS